MTGHSSEPCFEESPTTKGMISKFVGETSLHGVRNVAEENSSKARRYGKFIQIYNKLYLYSKK